MLSRRSFHKKLNREKRRYEKATLLMPKIKTAHITETSPKVLLLPPPPTFISDPNKISKMECDGDFRGLLKHHEESSINV